VFRFLATQAKPLAPSDVGLAGKNSRLSLGVKGDGNAPLLEVAGALDADGAILGPAEGGEQHGGEDGDDGDDHQQLNEGKTSPARPARL